MTSTRNRNTINDHRCEIDAHQKLHQHILFTPKYLNNDKNLPGDGLVNIHLSRDCLSSASVDIESELRGTRTADLVNGYTQVSYQNNSNMHQFNILDINDYHNKRFQSNIPNVKPTPFIGQFFQPWE